MELATFQRSSVSNTDQSIMPMELTELSLNSQFKRTFESYINGLESSPVRTLEELMQFMRDNAEKEFPPG